MRNFIAGVLATILTATVAGSIIWIAVLPRLDWGAGQEPTAIERTLAKNVLSRWMRFNASSSTNPIQSTPESLSLSQAKYEEHCAACHGLDGSGRNRFEARLYPPVPRLTGGIQRLSDGELYFIVANGIRNTAMPAFDKDHSRDDIWSMVFWVRHLAHLTPEEHRTIESRMHQSAHEHEQTMDHGQPSASH